MPNFLDPPGRRLAYDADGSVVTHYNVNTGAVTELTLANKQNLNDESGGTVFGPDWGVVVHLGFYFPGLRDITNLFHGSSGDTGFQGVDYSVDSTNPLDGTWTNLSYSQNAGSAVIPNYRQNWAAAVASGVKALRFRYQTNGSGGSYNAVHSAHIYGKRAAGDTSRQVAFVKADGTRFNKDFDYQDQGRGSIYKWKSGTLFNQTSELYVKNFSATETANTVVIGQEALSGSMLSNIRVSLDDVTYTTTLTINSIAPGASAGPIFVKWAPPANDILGLQTMRLPVTIGSWS